MSTPAIHEISEVPAGHPAWCDRSEQRCYLTDAGVRVHIQQPTRLATRAVVSLRFETSLIQPTDEPAPYLELCFRDLAMRDQFYGLLSLDVATALRDQITAHLDAAR